jgi:hypothetical protein
MPDVKEGISLKIVVGSILQALREAKHIGDIESAKLHEAYKKEKKLSSFTIPAFTISDVEVELRFSIVGPSEEEKTEEEIQDLKVNISPDSIKKLEAHHISEMKIKISALNLRALEEN